MPRQQESELKQQLESTLIQSIIGVRQRRRTVEQQWLLGRRAWMNIGVDRRFISSDSSPANYDIPAGRRAAERTIVRGAALLTPKVKWFDVAPLDDVPESRVTNVDKYTWYILRKRIKSRSNINALVRSMFMYGLCHLKTSVQVKNSFVWPTQRVVDPFAFYIFPETVSNVQDADFVFEDFLWSYDKYNAVAQMAGSPVEPINKTDLVKPDWPYHLVERLAYQGITDPTADVELMTRNVSSQLEAVGAGFVSITELWLPKNDRLYQVYLAWNLKGGPKIVGFVESEYDEPLYRSVIHRALPGETYTNSMMDDITGLDNLQNDLANQFFEMSQWEQGIVAINDQMQHRTDTLKMKGRALWKLADDPRQVLQLLQPNITSTNQLRAWQVTLGLINALAGTGTIAEGQPGRNMPRAGGAVNNLINLSLADIQDVAELIEQEVLTPSLSDIHKVSTQFIPESQLMRIPGGKGLTGSATLKRADIVGDFEFEWIGTLQRQDEELNAQRKMIFLNMLPVLAPLLQQQGYTFNIVEFVRSLWRDTLGQRGLQDIVVRIEDLQQWTQEDQAEGQADRASKGIAGMQYNLPNVTNGFVR